MATSNGPGIQRRKITNHSKTEVVLHQEGYHLAYSVAMQAQDAIHGANSPAICTQDSSLGCLCMPLHASTHGVVIQPIPEGTIS
jgi:hypothetical protein